jgi:hypothetical protein
MYQIIASLGICYGVYYYYYSKLEPNYDDIELWSSDDISAPILVINKDGTYYYVYE